MSLEKYISPYIATQLPRIYREEGPAFVSFIKAYYEFMEQSNGVLSESRNLLEYRDIDTTLPEFIQYFKDKYMAGVPENLVGDQRTLQKHIKEIYGTKGTIRGLELVFRLLSNQNIDVYYPGDDLLKPSDGTWIKPTYLEVSVNPINVLLIGEQVTGRESGATAIVEDFQLRYINRRQINVLYLSNVRGTFKTGELLLNNVITDPLKSPAVVGSMTDILMNESGFDYAVGDVLQVIGGSGILGQAVVANTSARSGSVEFSIRDGGSGYANDSIWAPTTVTVSAVDNTNPGIGATFKIGLLGDTEVITTPVDLIAPFANVSLGSSDYGFPTFITPENINTPLDQALNVQDITVGTILTLRAINPGAGYNGPVNVVVTNDVIGGLTLTDTKKGTIKGLNADINGQASAGRGAIDLVKILDSGLGYQNGDVVELRNETNPFIAGGTIRLGHEGQSAGYWKDTRSFLNSDKYIQDSFYYQEYSFEIRVALAFQRYANIIKRLWQPAGTEAFGKYVVGEEIESGSEIEEVKIDAIFITTYMTSYSTYVTTDRMTSTGYDSIYPTSYLTSKLTTTQRSTSTNILDALPELVVNGTFIVDLANWTASGDTTITRDPSQKMLVTTGASNNQVTQAITTTIGDTYYAQGDYSGGTASNVKMIASTSTDPLDAIASVTGPGTTGHVVLSFVATTATTYLILESPAGAGQSVLWDVISTKRLPESSKNTVYDTSKNTNTTYETNRSTNRLTASIYDTTRVTSYVTQQITLSMFNTNRSTNRMTSSVYDTTFGTDRITNRVTDTTVGTIGGTSRATDTTFGTTYNTFYSTNRATSTLGVTAYQTSRSTTTSKNTIYNTNFATSKATDTTIGTSQGTSKSTETNRNTAFITSFLTTFGTSGSTTTTYDTSRSTTFDTSRSTAFVSNYSTVYDTSQLTGTSVYTSNLTGTSVGTSKATGTSRATTTSFNTTTVYQIETQRFQNTHISGQPDRSTLILYLTTVTQATATSRSTTTSFNTTTAYISYFNTSTAFYSYFNTTTVYNTSKITSIGTSRNTTFATSRSTAYATNRSTATSNITTVGTTASTIRNTSFATTTAYVTSYNTSYGTTTIYDTARSTQRATNTSTTTLFDTVVATDKITDTTFDTYIPTTINTNHATSTTFNTLLQTAYETLTVFSTAFNTNRSTQIATATVYDTVFATNTLRVTDIVTSRVTAYNTTLNTLTTFSTVFNTVSLTNTTYNTNLDTVFVEIPTKFQTFFDTSTMAPTDYLTGYNTDRATDTVYDTGQNTARVTSVNTSTDLTF